MPPRRTMFSSYYPFSNYEAGNRFVEYMTSKSAILVAVLIIEDKPAPV